jgi:hypothetical protein
MPVDRHLQDYIEDAVILASRLADTEEGSRAVKEGMSTYAHLSSVQLIYVCC